MSARHCGGCGETIESAWRYCRACGHPTGFVPPPPQAASSKPTWVIVVVILVVMAVPVTGIIAAIAVPNLLTAMQRAKQKRTMADIRTIGIAIDAYAIDNNTYPPYGASLEDVADLVEPTYIRTLPRTDGWEREIRYHCLEPKGDMCARYALQSAGKDGLFDDLDYEIEREATRNFDCDILWANGAFVWYPEGVQQGGR